MKTYDVVVIPTTEGAMGDGLGRECPHLGVKVGSRTAAIRAAREAGYRVMSVGGCIELHDPEGGPAEWWVTVHA